MKDVAAGKTAVVIFQKPARPNAPDKDAEHEIPHPAGSPGVQPAGDSCGGGMVLRAQRKLSARRRQKDLQVIAGMKLQTIQIWMAERRGDAATLAKPFSLAEIERWQAAPADFDTSLIRQRLSLVCKHYNYMDAFLADSTGRILLSCEDSTDQLDDFALKSLKTALSENRITLTDFHTGLHLHDPHISLIAPLPARSAAAPPSSGPAAILLVCEATQFLFPFGYTVLTAQSPAEALRCAGVRGRNPPVITDVVMPGMNGRELTAKLCALRRG
jgi:hypothetical protein